MEKSKLLTFAVITLLVINLGTLGFLFLSGPKGHRLPKGQGPEGRQKPREIIIEKLHFEANQVAQYDKIIKIHKETIGNLDATIRESKNELYSQLQNETVNPKIKDSLMNVLSNCQKQIETAHFNHFEDIKKICKKNQMDDFNELTEELSRIFSPRAKPRHE